MDAAGLALALDVLEAAVDDRVDRVKPAFDLALGTAAAARPAPSAPVAAISAALAPVPPLTAGAAARTALAPFAIPTASLAALWSSGLALAARAPAAAELVACVRPVASRSGGVTRRRDGARSLGPRPPATAAAARRTRRLVRLRSALALRRWRSFLRRRLCARTAIFGAGRLLAGAGPQTRRMQQAPPAAPKIPQFQGRARTILAGSIFAQCGLACALPTLDAFDCAAEPRRFRRSGPRPAASPPAPARTPVLASSSRPLTAGFCRRLDRRRVARRCARVARLRRVVRVGVHTIGSTAGRQTLPPGRNQGKRAPGFAVFGAVLLAAPE